MRQIAKTRPSVPCAVCSSFSLTGVQSFESGQHGAIRQAELFILFYFILFIFCREGDNTRETVRRRPRSNRSTENWPRCRAKIRILSLSSAPKCSVLLDFMLPAIRQLLETSRLWNESFARTDWKLYRVILHFFFSPKRNMNNVGDINEPLRKRLSTTEEVEKVVCDRNVKCMAYTVWFFHSSKLRHQI